MFRLKLIPARLESLAKFIERAPNGKLLVPNDPKARPYGGTPYENMENGEPRVFARYKLPKGLRSMDRVVVVGDNAWPVKLEGPGLKATGNEVAIESIELAHEGLTVETA